MSIMEKIPIWIDCDPGHDDAIAILLLALHPSFKLVGISTVFGNSALSNTTRNALKVLEVLGFRQDEINVYTGEERPLVKGVHFAPDIHGKSGLGGVDTSEPNLVVSKDMTYTEAIRKAVLEHENKICLLITGACTNAYKLFKKYPELKSKVNLISIMGGALGSGNVTPYAEFNFYADPHAANGIVTDPELGGKILLTPTDFTHTVICTPEIRKKMYQELDPTKNSFIRQFFHAIVMFYAEAYRKSENMTEGPPVHDPLAAFILVPVLHRAAGVADEINFQSLKKRISVAVEGEREGQCILEDDGDDQNSLKYGIEIGLKINNEVFWNYILKALDVSDNRGVKRQD